MEDWIKENSQIRKEVKEAVYLHCIKEEDLEKVPEEFKCDQCVYQTSFKVNFESHKD